MTVVIHSPYAQRYIARTPVAGTRWEPPLLGDWHQVVSDALAQLAPDSPAFKSTANTIKNKFRGTRSQLDKLARRYRLVPESTEATDASLILDDPDDEVYADALDLVALFDALVMSAEALYEDEPEIIKRATFEMARKLDRLFNSGGHIANHAERAGKGEI